MRAYIKEINVQTLISSTIFGQPVTSEILKIYSPALLMRSVGCKIILSAGRPFADCSDVLSDFHGQIVDVMRIPRIVLIDGAAHGTSRHHAEKWKEKSQQ
jgi:hypothetical protein